MLYIVASYHCMQFQGKRMIQTQENGKRPYFVVDLGSLAPNFGHQVLGGAPTSNVTFSIHLSVCLSICLLRTISQGLYVI